MMWIRSQYEYASIVDGLRPAARLAAISAFADLGEGPALLHRCPFGFCRALLGALHRHPLAQLAERCLGLGAGEPVDVSLAVHEPEPALNLAATVAPLRDPGVAVGSGATHERPAPVAGAPLGPRDGGSLRV